MTAIHYEYQDADGGVRFRVTRRDEGAGRKSFTQAYRETADGEWIFKAPPWPRPIYNLPRVLAEADATVLVVEGEKTAVNAQKYLPRGWVITTWSGGSSAVRQTDWTPLKGRRVVVWPDIDQQKGKDGALLPFAMQPGSKAAAAVAAATGGAVVDIPDIFA